MIMCVHRGSNQIGGSCLELKSGVSSILLDYGLPLDDIEISSARSRNQIPQQCLLPLTGLHKEESPRFDGILLSHAHPDHHGLLGYVHPEIPVYANQETQELLSIGQYFRPAAPPVRNLRTIAAGEPFTVGAFRVTPHLIDHSAYGALAFLVEAGEKRVFYSGDFRGHGRKREVFDQLLADPPAPVDALVMEGTVLGRAETGLPSEKAVQNELERILRSRSDLTFIAFSSQNTDRLESVFYACLRTGKTLVIDPYTAFILDRLGGKLPQYYDKGINIFFGSSSHTSRMAKRDDLWRFKPAKISFQDILEKRCEMVIKNNFAVRKKFASTGELGGAALVYSQWWGYYDSEREFWAAHGIEPIHVHTSGHAFVADLQALVRALQPRRIIPIHTQRPEAYAALFGPEVQCLPDGQILEI